MNFPRKKNGKQGTWLSALSLFFVPLFLIFSFRWFIYEPFVIPSESMVPNLLIHDHIVVKKFSYGFKWPIGDGWIYKWNQPQRGDIIVFRYPENRDIFYIKRLIGLPGDLVKVQAGQISINGEPWGLQKIDPQDYQIENDIAFDYFLESPISSQNSDKQKISAISHIVRLYSKEDHLLPESKEFRVPENSYFAMGDNRDQSHDSRFWGFIPDDFLVGRASLIWLSCEETLITAPFICDPLKLRSNRLFKLIH